MRIHARGSRFRETRNDVAFASGCSGRTATTTRPCPSWRKAGMRRLSARCSGPQSRRAPGVKRSTPAGERSTANTNGARSKCAPFGTAGSTARLEAKPARRTGRRRMESQSARRSEWRRWRSRMEAKPARWSRRRRWGSRTDTNRPRWKAKRRRGSVEAGSARRPGWRPRLEAESTGRPHCPRRRARADTNRPRWQGRRRRSQVQAESTGRPRWR